MGGVDWHFKDRAADGSIAVTYYTLTVIFADGARLLVPFLSLAALDRVRRNAGLLIAGYIIHREVRI